MKLILGIGALLLITFFLIVDYMWKRWIRARRQEHDHSSGPKA